VFNVLIKVLLSLTQAYIIYLKQNWGGVLVLRAEVQILAQDLRAVVAEAIFGAEDLRN